MKLHYANTQQVIYDYGIFKHFAFSSGVPFGPGEVKLTPVYLEGAEYVSMAGWWREVEPSQFVRYDLIFENEPYLMSGHVTLFRDNWRLRAFFDYDNISRMFHTVESPPNGWHVTMQKMDA